MATEPSNSATVIETHDGHQIHLRCWLPDTDAVGIVQVLHGLGEHCGRYARFAAAANARGLAVVAHDHRGHGGHREQQGYYADRRGWQRLTDDTLSVHRHAVERLPDRPVALLGHSMGSFVAQQFAMLHGDRLAGLLLSGSSWPSRGVTLAGHLLARVECLRRGPRGESTLLDKLGFDGFNRRFEPARTRMDWLSRDEAEVDKYIADPLCGGPFSAGLWRDLTGGMLGIASDDALLRISSDLPILISGGSADPVGGEDGMAKLALHYAQTGHQRVSVRIYADGRHEMLNETNRDEVTRDWLNWIFALPGFRRA